jgi:hypothetical protein
MAVLSPQETNRFFAACARSTYYAATAKNSVWKRSVKIDHSYKTLRERNAKGSSCGLTLQMVVDAHLRLASVFGLDTLPFWGAL